MDGLPALQDERKDIIFAEAEIGKEKQKACSEEQVVRRVEQEIKIRDDLQRQEDADDLPTHLFRAAAVRHCSKLQLKVVFPVLQLMIEDIADAAAKSPEEKYGDRREQVGRRGAAHDHRDDVKQGAAVHGIEEDGHVHPAFQAKRRNGIQHKKQELNEQQQVRMVMPVDKRIADEDARRDSAEEEDDLAFLQMHQHIFLAGPDVVFNIRPFIQKKTECRNQRSER